MSGRVRKPCVHWPRGRCRFGAACKFEQDRSAARGHTRETTNHHQDQNPAQKSFLDWRRSRPRTGLGSARPWIHYALTLLDGDVDVAQQVVRELASENGLHVVRSMIESVEDPGSEESRRQYLAETLMPLFRILCHQRIIDSAVLEQEVGVLYRCLVGIDAARLQLLFNFIFDVAELTELQDETLILHDGMLESLSVSAGILAKVVDSSTLTLSQHNPAFCQIAELFSAILRRMPNPRVNFHCLQATKHLKYVQRRLGIGQALPAKSTSSRPAAPNRAHFTLTQDLPGALSRQGSRHDNDHEKIARIALMPTRNEIVSLRDEYLPTTNSDMHHLPGIQGLLDRHFRLLREDTFYDVRNAVRCELEQLAGQSPSKRPGELRTKVRSYQLVRGASMDFRPREGLELEVAILQPPMARHAEKRKRVEAWTQSQRLSPGSLVCAVDELGTAVFLLVSSSTQISASTQESTMPQQITDDSVSRRKPGLADDSKFAYLCLQPIEPTAAGFIDAITWFKSLSGPFHCRLLEFPGVLVQSALPPLKALQKMSSDANIPFQDILVNPSQVGSTVTPPLYSLRPGFSFDLSCVCSDGARLQYRSSDNPDAQMLTSHSRLDLSQASAILNSLHRSVAATLGPPGTGKSYTGESLIRVLLANREAAQLGPIICVCYTNHALDQLLEHLLDAGVEQIVRIGSRSKSERLAEVNLRKIAKETTRTRLERKRLYESHSVIDGLAEAISSQLRSISSTRTDDLIKTYLAEHSPPWHHAIFGVTEDEQDGFQTVRRKKKSDLRNWLTSGHDTQDVERGIDELQFLWASNLSRRERLVLYHHWVSQATAGKLEEASFDFEGFVKRKAENESLRADLDLRCLESARIVGVTTTGLARNLELLRRVRSKVLLCEEAGEVLEGHLLTALLPSIEQVVLIGDHLQLRPQIQDWRLQRANPAGVKYSLDTSLFERLVQPDPNDNTVQGIPLTVLDTQRRMHPSIANLVRSTLYPHLIDADNVSDYPDIPGMADRLFWMDHAWPESGHEKNEAVETSHSNDFEVQMVSELVSHLLRQGTYESGDIAVLTPYLGQLHKIRNRLGSTTQIVLNDRDTGQLIESELVTASQIGKSSSLAEVRVATVDNFQGEEARVVIVSLVRSNEARRPGFLNTSNRINVLLSRARHGMYLIGNASTFSTVPMWSDVRRLLGDSCGPRLRLQCPRHPSTEIRVEKPEDFLILAPDGGCTLPCERRLACGHACTGPCHAPMLHSAVKCLEPCPRMKEGCDHSCPQACGEPCETRCNVRVEDIEITLGCGHLMTSAPCWQAQKPSEYQCAIPVPKRVPGCGHERTVPCFVDVTRAYRCLAPCNSDLPCGHTCKRPCHQCCQTNEEGLVVMDHGPCHQRCGRKYTTCSHDCQKKCHGEAPCAPCAKPCENRCQHSKCDRKCSEPCVPCAEAKCSSRCPHSACSMPCAAPCDWIPCSLRCDKTLTCGHRCPSVCGEECPSRAFCQVCGDDNVKAMVVDYIMYAQYKDIDLDQDPCIFPDCGHPLTFASMDGTMGVAEYYVLSPEGIPTALKGTQQSLLSPSDIPIKVCPTCRGSLRSISRYGGIVRRGLLDETTKKFITWASSRLNQLVKEFAAVEAELESEAPALDKAPEVVKVDCTMPRAEVLEAMCDALCTGTRLSPLKRVRRRLQMHLQQVGKDEQPYQRVANLIRYMAKARYEVEVQMSGYVKTLGILLRCDLLILGKYLSRAPDRAAATLGLSIEEYIADGKTLVQLAREKTLPKSEAGGHILQARFHALRATVEVTVPAQLRSHHTSRELAEGQLRSAENVLQAYPSASTLQPELDLAKREVHHQAFYSGVSEEERLAIYKAMSGEFLGTGHWYRCEQGHPFTVGECGMPMQLARCPECGAQVGGQSHQPVQGVQRDDEMEELGRDVNRVRI